MTDGHPYESQTGTTKGACARCGQGVREHEAGRETPTECIDRNGRRECEPCKRWDHAACKGNCACCVTRAGREATAHDVADSFLAESDPTRCGCSAFTVWRHPRSLCDSEGGRADAQPTRTVERTPAFIEQERFLRRRDWTPPARETT